MCIFARATPLNPDCLVLSIKDTWNPLDCLRRPGFRVQESICGEKRLRRRLSPRAGSHVGMSKLLCFFLAIYFLLGT